MKKKLMQWLLISSILCTGLCATACGQTTNGAGGENRVSESAAGESQAAQISVEEYRSVIDVNDEDAVKEFNHKVFLANMPEGIFQNHESYSSTWSMPVSETALDEFHYNDKNSVYNEWSDGFKEYIKDRVNYSAYYGEEGSFIQFGLNINEDDSLFYSTLIANVEEEAYNPEWEVIDRIYEKDGLIHVQTHLNETGVQAWIRDALGRDAEGEKIFTELVIDSETYEAESLIYTWEKNGQTETVFVGTVQYDVPMPKAVEALCSFFERETENMMTYTVVADKGTEKELTVSATIPQNTECVYMYEGNSVYFNDPEYTTLAHWNRMDDAVMYVVREPDEELIARYQQAYQEVMDRMQSEQ